MGAIRSSSARSDSRRNPAAASWSSWAPPGGSGTMPSTRPSSSKSGAVSRRAAAACSALPGIAVDDRGAAFRGDHAVDRVFEHEDHVADAQGERSAAAALADADHQNGDGQAGHLAQIAGDRLGLAALLGVDAGVGAGSVQEGDHGPAELGGQLHRAQRLAVAFRLRHAEVAVELLLGVAALLLGHDHDGPAFEAGQAGDNGGIVAEGAVAVDLLKIGEDALDVVERVGALGVAGELHPPPRRMRLGGLFGNRIGASVWLHSEHLNKRPGPIWGQGPICEPPYRRKVLQPTAGRVFGLSFCEAKPKLKLGGIP